VGTLSPRVTSSCRTTAESIGACPVTPSPSLSPACSPAHAQEPGARIINPDGTITVPYQVALAQRTLDDDGQVAVFALDHLADPPPE
jgi:hypothetical protein